VSTELAAATSARVVRRMAGEPVFALRLVLPGGSRRESIPGQALVTARMLFEGTRRRDWRSLAEAAEARGLTVAGFAGVESHGLAVDGLAEDWRLAIELAAELLFESSFPADRLGWIARHAEAELEAQEDQADVRTGRAFAAALYGEHPKGRPLQGTPEGLRRLDPTACAAFHSAALERGGFVVAAGTIDETEVAAALGDAFASLAAPGSNAFVPPPLPPQTARRDEIRTRARDQAHLFVGQLTVDRFDPDFEALELAAVAFGAGAGLSGRIPLRLRDREGLAYAAHADLVQAAGLDPGRLVAYVGTAPDNLERAEEAVREELRRLVDGSVTELELVDALSYLLGREPFRRETARLWADLAAYGRVLGLPLEDTEWRAARLRAVTPDGVAAALRRRLAPEALTVMRGLPR